jgi:membrane fusion protein (multidrug efflux system)
MRKPLILAALAVAAVGSGGLVWYLNVRHIETTDNAAVVADIVSIAPKVPGRVTRLPVADNQPVRTGDVLMAIDDADYRAALDQAAAAFSAAKAAVEVADANIVLAGNAVEEAEASLASAQAERTRATADLARYRTLSAAQYASQQKMQTAQADSAKAVAAVDRAQAALATQKRRFDLLAAERRQAVATAERAEAELAAARLRLADTVIAAPVDGVVGNKGVRIGQYVQPGQQAMSLVPVEAAYIVANFKETQVARMRQGQPVEISVDAYRDRTLKGRVDSLSPGSGAVFSLLPPENATGNFTKIVQRVPVKIVLDEASRRVLLIPGMSVVARVDTRDGTPLTAEAAFVRPAALPQTAQMPAQDR